MSTALTATAPTNGFLGGNGGAPGAALKLRSSAGPFGAPTGGSTALLNDNEFPSLLTRAAAQIAQPNAAAAVMPPNAFVPTTSFGAPSSSAFGFRGDTPFGAPPSALSHAAGRAPYANLMKQASDSQQHPSASNEFRIQNEDFPALPGASHETQATAGVPAASTVGDVTAMATRDARFPGDASRSPGAPTAASQLARGIRTFPDGTVTGIPPGMLNDQFGMAGLLTFLRAIETDPGIVALALGHDLTTLGLNLNAPEKNLYQSFGGPWADYPCRPLDLDANVPEEYQTNAQIGAKLPAVKLNRLSDDVLFWLFYNFPGDLYQLAAAVELYSRDWRYHKEERMWLTRAQVQVSEQTGSYERGWYNCFDPLLWTKTRKEMTLEYAKLEERQAVPSVAAQAMGGGGAAGAS